MYNKVIVKENYEGKELRKIKEGRRDKEWHIKKRYTNEKILAFNWMKPATTAMAKPIQQYE